MKSWIMLLAIVSAVGIVAAQSEEVVANFYGDKSSDRSDRRTSAHFRLCPPS
jgi:hypothetical protein